MFEGLMTDEYRLRLLKIARDKSGLSLDFWEEFTEGVDHKCLEILVGRSSMFPKYKYSKVKP